MADYHAARLTKREAEVCVEVLQGKSNASIAAKFGISERTVESHIQNIRNAGVTLPDRPRGPKRKNS